MHSILPLHTPKLTNGEGHPQRNKWLVVVMAGGGGSRGSLLTAPYPQTNECRGASIPPVHGLDGVHNGLVTVYRHRHQRQTGGVHCHLKKGQTTHAYYTLCTCFLMKRVESILTGRTCTCSDARTKQRRE